MTLTLPPQPALSMSTLRDQIVGIDTCVPLLNGATCTYVNFDNGASTPALRPALDKVNELMTHYSSIHRGAGFKSLVSTRAYETARQVTAEFVGADPQADVVIFGKNTTEATNTLAAVMPWEEDDVVLCSLLEHHSNDLPWRQHAQVVYIDIDHDGQLDLADYALKLRQYAGHIRLVAVTGAANVTGFTPPVYQMAEMAHHAGARILVDCAQLAAHRPIHKGRAGTPRYLDFVTLSAHKIYAPFGTGALIGPAEFFNQAPPQMVGGGVIEIVTHDEVLWAPSPERNEAGSPNVPGAVALAASLRTLQAVGMQAIAEHEKELTHHILRRLREVEGLQIAGSADPERLDDRLGVIAFNLAGVPHAKVAAILAYEAGIGVRNGCFCAHPYILRLLKVDDATYQAFRTRVLHHDRSDLPGLVRASFGCYNTCDEIDYLVEWLQRIRRGQFAGDYVLDLPTGSYLPRGWDESAVAKVFSL
jgi:cysteine desulfurase / selenocysteine lyase